MYTCIAINVKAYHHWYNPDQIKRQNNSISTVSFRIQEFVKQHEGSSVSIFFDAYLQDFDYLGHSYVPPGAAGMYVKSSIAIPCIFTYPPVSCVSS